MQEIEDRVRELIAGYLDKNSIELVDISYRPGDRGMALKLLVDTPVGITVAECARINNYLSELLDKYDVIQEKFLLEVSSPGLDRPFSDDRDFKRAMGKEIEVTTYAAIDMKKTHEGKLIGMDNEKIVIEAAGISTVIPRELIAMARLRIEF